MKKNLLIVGSYPSTEVGEDILSSALKQVNLEFDVLLATHCPVNKDIQGLVKYFIYDIRNECLEKDPTTNFYADYPEFSFKLYKPKGTKDHSYPVYRSILNAVNMLGSQYDSFYYMEGDCVFSIEDIHKIKHFEKICEQENKEAVFFEFPQFLSSFVFYSKMKFFKDTFNMSNSPEEYYYHARSIGSYGALENFLYKSAQAKGSLGKIHAIKTRDLSEYFSTSTLGMSSFVGGDVQFSNAYVADVCRVEGTENIGFVYLTNSSSVFGGPVDLFLDGEKITTIPNGPYATAITIFPKKDEFFIRFGDAPPIKYNNHWALNPENRSFVKFKNNQ
jgi:hypothetical protein